MVEKSNSSFYIILLFICCLHYNNQLQYFHYKIYSIITRIVFLDLYYMISIFWWSFPIHDDHCKLTFTTSTSFFVSRAHTYYLFFTPRIHVYGGRLFGKELHPVCYYYICSFFPLLSVLSFTLVVKDTCTVSIIMSFCWLYFLFLWSIEMIR